MAPLVRGGSSAGRTIDDLLFQVTDNRIDCALGKEIGAGLVCAAVGNGALQQGVGKKGEDDNGEEDDETQHHDQSESTAAPCGRRKIAR